MSFAKFEKCPHDDPISGKCELCNDNVCDCYKITDDDRKVCETCFHKAYPEDFKYTFDIPDAKDETPVVVFTNAMHQAHVRSF